MKKPVVVGDLSATINPHIVWEVERAQSLLPVEIYERLSGYTAQVGLSLPHIDLKGSKAQISQNDKKAYEGVYADCDDQTLKIRVAQAAWQPSLGSGGLQLEPTGIRPYFNFLHEVGHGLNWSEVEEEQAEYSFRPDYQLAYSLDVEDLTDQSIQTCEYSYFLPKEKGGEHEHEDMARDEVFSEAVAEMISGTSYLNKSLREVFPKSVKLTEQILLSIAPTLSLYPENGEDLFKIPRGLRASALPGRYKTIGEGNGAFAHSRVGPTPNF